MSRDPLLSPPLISSTVSGSPGDSSSETIAILRARTHHLEHLLVQSRGAEKEALERVQSFLASRGIPARDAQPHSFVDVQSVAAVIKQMHEQHHQILEGKMKEWEVVYAKQVEAMSLERASGKDEKDNLQLCQIIDEKSKKITDLEQRIASLEESVTEWKSKYTCLKNESEEILRLQSQSSILEGQISDLLAENQKLRARIQSLRKNSSSRVEEMKQANAALEAEVKRLSTSLAAGGGGSVAGGSYGLEHALRKERQTRQMRTSELESLRKQYAVVVEERDRLDHRVVALEEANLELRHRILEMDEGYSIGSHPEDSRRHHVLGSPRAAHRMAELEETCRLQRQEISRLKGIVSKHDDEERSIFEQDVFSLRMRVEELESNQEDFENYKLLVEELNSENEALTQELFEVRSHLIATSHTSSIERSEYSPESSPSYSRSPSPTKQISTFQDLSTSNINAYSPDHSMMTPTLSQHSFPASGTPPSKHRSVLASPSRRSENGFSSTEDHPNTLSTCSNGLSFSPTSQLISPQVFQSEIPIHSSLVKSSPRSPSEPSRFARKIESEPQVEFVDGRVLVRSENGELVTMDAYLHALHASALSKS